MNRSDAIKSFLRERTRPPESPSDFVFAAVLHREFLRWGRVRSKIGTSLEEIVSRTVHKTEPKLGEFVKLLDGLGYHGQELTREKRVDIVYDLRLLDQEAVLIERARAREKFEDVVLEKLVCRQELEFTDAVIPAGAIVEHVEAGPVEQRGLDREYERDAESLKDQARPWIVILWQGKRRLVRSGLFARLPKVEEASTLPP